MCGVGVARAGRGRPGAGVGTPGPGTPRTRYKRNTLYKRMGCPRARRPPRPVSDRSNTKHFIPCEEMTRCYAKI